MIPTVAVAGAMLLQMPNLPPCPADRPIPTAGECQAGFVDPFVVFFDAASTALAAGGRQMLDNVVRTFRLYPGNRLLIAGHVDRLGSREEEFRTSWRRAESARRYLIRRGIPAAALSVRAFGAGRPLVPSEHPDRERMNGRVEIVFAPALQ